ncbi:MAG TPA: hypothetical protein VIL30_05970 [Ramlibacter sp.]|jgi:hypothetical protein
MRLWIGVNVQTFLDTVLLMSSRTGTSQQVLGEYCGRSQAHISKVLRGKAPLSRAVKASLEEWLSHQSPMDDVPTKPEIEAIVAGILAASPERRMHIMHILRELSALA